MLKKINNLDNDLDFRLETDHIIFVFFPGQLYWKLTRSVSNFLVTFLFFNRINKNS